MSDKPSQQAASEQPVDPGVLEADHPYVLALTFGYEGTLAKPKDELDETESDE